MKASLLFFTLLFSCRCSRLDIIRAVSGSLNASFSVPAGLIYENCPVKFTNKSSGATTYLWNFGDGTTSTEEEPVHSFSSSGNYTVSLAAQTASSSNDTSIQITVYQTQQFKKSIFPGTGNNFGKCVLLAQGDGYIITGQAQASAGAEKAYLAKTDGNGTVLWEKQFGNGN